MGIIKNLKRGKRKIANTYMKIRFNFKRRMTLKKICTLLEIEVPKELKKIQNKKVPEVTRIELELKDNCIFFCQNLEKFKKDEKIIKEKSLCIFSEVPIEGCNNIVIENTFEAYTKVIKYIRELSGPKVITVTGSIGKTSTKDMIRSVIEKKYKNMFVSKGNSNSYYRISKNIKSLSPLNKIYLQEVGLGPTKLLFKENAIMLEPEVVVYTNILDAHIEYYGSKENIAKYKTQLSKYGKQNGLAIINYDDEILRKQNFKQTVLSYSLKNKKATYYAKNIKISSEGTAFTIVDNKENIELEVELKVIGEHHIQNALAAYAVGKYLNIKNKSIVSGLKKYKTTGMRQNLIPLGDYRIYADCYNASLNSIETAVKTLEVLIPEKEGEKIAVLGDIFDLGDFSKETHKKVGALLTKYNIDKIIFFGNDMKYAHEEYKSNKNNSIYVNNRDKLHEEIEKILKPGDIILFKASHGMHLTESIDFIFGTDMADKANIGERNYEEKQDNNFKYYEFPYNITLLKYLENKKEIKLPELINNKPINKVGKGMFKGDKNIETIIFSKNICRIKSEAFQDSSLKEIKLNTSLKSIGTRSFAGCANLKEIVLPQNVIFIEKEAFMNCKNLQKIVIPRSVKKLAKTAFNNSPNVIIYGYKNSFAEKYAKENKIEFERIEEK
ncbi:MAG: Mur ligase family protein [Bacilli bacterium]